MDTVVDALRQHETLSSTWYMIVWLSAAFLIVNGAAVFVSPATANRFLDGYVRSPRINFLESTLRFFAGFGFMGASPDMNLSPLFFWFGAVLTMTAVPMMFLYGPHKRYAAWAIAFVKRILSLYGLMSLALGGLIIWALV